MNNDRLQTRQKIVPGTSRLNPPPPETVYVQMNCEK